MSLTAVYLQTICMYHKFVDKYVSVPLHLCAYIHPQCRAIFFVDYKKMYDQS